MGKAPADEEDGADGEGVGNAPADEDVPGNVIAGIARTVDLGPFITSPADEIAGSERTVDAGL